MSTSQTNQPSSHKGLPGFTVIQGPDQQKYLVPNHMVEATLTALEYEAPENLDDADGGVSDMTRCSVTPLT